MKICIIGHSGAGKSTLARALGEKYSIPVLHLDNTYWYDDWQERPRSEQSAQVVEFMENNPENWIIEGNYLDVCPNRFDDCDRIYFLDFGRFLCFKQARKRYKEYKGQVRPDCPCKEKFDLSFALWILYYGRTKERYEWYADVMSRCEGDKFVFKNTKELDGYLASLQ